MEKEMQRRSKEKTREPGLRAETRKDSQPGPCPGIRKRKTVRPGYLSQTVRADERRMEFDCKNETVVQKNWDVDLVFIGDSITQMWELPVYFGEYHLRILNRGIGGDRTCSLLHRFYADAVQLRPKAVVLMAGINDSWDLEFDYWKQEEGKTLETVLKEALFNMEQILQMAEREGIAVVLCSILPTCMEWTNHEKERQEYVRLYNAGLKKLSQKYNMEFADYYLAFTAEDGRSLRKELSMEGLHPNVLGYDKMAEILKSTVDFWRFSEIKEK